MLKKCLPLFLLLTAAVFAWQANYGTDRIDICYNAEPTSDGGFIASGYAEHPSDFWFDGYFMKLNMSGEMEWEIYFGQEYYQDKGYDGIEADDGYLFTGWTGSYGALGDDVFVLKVSEDGDTLWRSQFGTMSTDHAFDIAKAEGENYLVAGETFAYGMGDPDVYIGKFDSRGDTLWTNHYGTTDHEKANEIMLTSDNNYLIAGASWTTGMLPDTNLYVIKINTEGTELWSQTWDPGYDDVAWGITEDASGNYIIVGFTSPTPGHPDIYVRKISPDGDSLWANTYGGAGNEIAHSVVALGDGSIVISGWASYEAYIMKLDSDGEIVWENSIGSIRDDRFFSIAKFGSSFVMGGTTKSYGLGSPETEDFFIVTANSTGDAGSDCIPAFSWAACPFPIGTNVACSDQDMVFGVIDQTGLTMNTEFVFGRRIIETTDDMLDTTYFSYDHEDVSIEERSDTMYITISGTYDHGTRVYCIIDSVENEEGCRTYPGEDNHFYIDTEPLYVTSLTPSPGSTIDPAIETLIMGAEITDEMSGIVSDSASSYVRWIANDFDRMLFRWNWEFRTNRTTTYETFEEGDSIMVCVHAEENTNDSYCACERRELDTCWVFYMGSGSTEVNHDYDVTTGWNIISNPFTTPVNIEANFTSAILPSYTYNTSTGGYDAVTDMVRGQGVWLLNSATEIINIRSAEFSTSLDLSLNRGWNMISGPGLDIPAAMITGLSSVIPPIYRYFEGGYVAVDTLEPGLGYWCLASESSSITLPTSMGLMIEEVIITDSCVSYSEDPREPEVEIDGNDVHLETLVMQNCCKDSSHVEIELSGNIIHIIITESLTMPCDCNCNYGLYADFTLPGPGNYTISIENDEYEDDITVPIIIE